MRVPEGIRPRDLDQFALKTFVNALIEKTILHFKPYDGDASYFDESRLSDFHTILSYFPITQQNVQSEFEDLVEDKHADYCEFYKRDTSFMSISIGLSIKDAHFTRCFSIVHTAIGEYMSTKIIEPEVAQIQDPVVVEPLAPTLVECDSEPKDMETIIDYNNDTIPVAIMSSDVCETDSNALEKCALVVHEQCATSNIESLEMELSVETVSSKVKKQTRLKPKRFSVCKREVKPRPKLKSFGVNDFQSFPSHLLLFGLPEYVNCSCAPCTGLRRAELPGD